MKCCHVALFLLCSFWMIGCGGTYHYYTDSSVKLENNRSQYVQFNPGAPHNNQILAGNIKSGMTRDEINAAWGSPSAIAPGDLPDVEEVWAYHDPDQSHGNIVWLLRFSGGTLQNVEKLVGTMMAAGGAEATTHNGEQSQTGQGVKPR
jgi:hypothetical protein